MQIFSQRMAVVFWIAIGVIGVIGAVAGQHLDLDAKGFDDTIQFKINWPGSIEREMGMEAMEAMEVMEVMTPGRERYKCRLPELNANNSEDTEQYNGFGPLELLAALNFPQLCSYRVESYWTYEVCHGQYVRQYHEDREGKKVKLQEYYLGRWDKTKQKKLEEEMAKEDERGSKLKYKKIEGMNLPYVEFEMGDGTTCDLNNKPRTTKVQYVCFSNRKHEIYTFKETSTCEYEVTILSPFLCAHPKYKPKNSEENIIDCLPEGDAPRKPRAVLEMEAESYMYNQKIHDGETKMKMELHPIDYENSIEGTSPQSEHSSQVFVNNDLVRAFLDGENCLEGGSGWWKYDFCYGKHVKQIHVDDKAGMQTVVLLGEFIEEDHLAWLAENPHKKPKPKDQRLQISHFYSRGNVCAQTKKPRQTEVKLKCLKNASSPSQVSLYMLEPKICQYILGIESPLICEILDMADDNGLIKWPTPSKNLLSEGEISQEEEDDVEPTSSAKIPPKKLVDTFDEEDHVHDDL